MVAQCFGQGAAPTIVSQPTAMFSMVEDWIHLATVADDGSLAFGQGILSSIKPVETVLMPNYPNPFNPETWIPFQLAQDSTVTAKIYDVTSKLIRMIELGHVTAGNYVESNRAIYWDGRTEEGEQVSSGTYFYQIQAGDYTDTRKMVILK